MRANTKGIGPGRLALPNGEAKAALPTRWRSHGACKDIGATAAGLRIFFDGEPEHALKKYCNGCAVRPTCLAFALLNDERYGVWGGTTQEERHALHEHGSREILTATKGALPVLIELLKRRIHRPKRETAKTLGD